MFTSDLILDFPANDIVKFLLGFTNKGSENFIVESLDASFRYPQDFQFYIQNFTALQLGTVVPPQRQATFEYSFIPAEPMGGRPFGLVINLNYKDSSVSVIRQRLVTLPQIILTDYGCIHNRLWWSQNFTPWEYNRACGTGKRLVCDLSVI